MQNGSPSYRKARPDDAQAIADFQVRMAFETEGGLKLNPPTVIQGVQAVFVAPERGQYFVAELEGLVIASLLITYEWSDWRNGQVWWVHSVYVEPAHRDKKVFRGLYCHIQALVQADPYLRGLRLYVEKTNELAQKVYNKIGMNGEHYHLFEWMKTF